MRICEIQPKNKTPDQQKLDSLKHTKDLATKALETERKRQQINKAQNMINALKMPKAVN
jgi:hypothetical protein